MSKSNFHLELTAKEMCCLEIILSLVKNDKNKIKTLDIIQVAVSNMKAEPQKIKSMLSYFSKKITVKCDVLCKQ